MKVIAGIDKTDGHFIGFLQRIKNGYIGCGINTIPWLCISVIRVEQYRIGRITEAATGFKRNRIPGTAERFIHGGESSSRNTGRGGRIVGISTGRGFLF